MSSSISPGSSTTPASTTASGKKRGIMELLNEKRQSMTPPAPVPFAPAPPTAVITASSSSSGVSVVPRSTGSLPTHVPTSVSSQPPAVTVAAAPAAKKPKATKATMKPHVLIWICHYGPQGQSRKWSMKNPKVIGIYRSKEEAEAKKRAIIARYGECGHGDIVVGGLCDDEIDLLVRPAEECTLFDDA